MVLRAVEETGERWKANDGVFLIAWPAGLRNPVAIEYADSTATHIAQPLRF